MSGYALPEGLGHAVRRLVDALVAAGAAQTLGVPDLPGDEEPAAAAPVPRAAPRPDDWVSREAARGLVELERFLDRPCFR
jgi:hypothetical protein